MPQPNKRQLLSLLLLFFTLLFAACRSAEGPEPTATAAISTKSTITPANTPTAAPTDSPIPALTETPEPPQTPEPIYEPVFEAASCAFGSLSGYEATCGYLIVPEDRANPDGRMLRLHVAIFDSESDNPEPDPVIYLEGGPGGDALETVRFSFADGFAPFLGERDFIMFDQRGTGYSEPSLACSELDEAALFVYQNRVTDEEQNTLFNAALSECRVRLVDAGIDLTQYNSVNSAADLNDLRIALGYDEWNLYGISYGTKLALTTMRDYPEALRSVILDSAYPQQVALNAELPANTNRAFETLFAGCADDAACHAAYPDLETRFYALYDALNKNPAKVDATNFLNGRSYEAVLDGDQLISAIFLGLYSKEIIPVLPQAIVDAENGDFDLLGALMSLAITNIDFISRGVYFSVQCHEEAPFETVEEVDSAILQFPNLATYFGDAEAFFDTCALWQSGTADAQENEPVRSDIPTLVMAGQYDPITPPAWGKLTAATLPNSFFFEYPGVGHGVSVADDCPRGMAIAFLNDPNSAPASDCIAEMAPPNFSVPFVGEEAAFELVEFEAEDGLVGIRPEGWEEVIPGMFARADSALDQTMIVQLALPGQESSFFLEALFPSVLDNTNLEPVDEFEDENGRIWQLYETEQDGYLVDFALLDSEDIAYTVMMFTTEADNARFFAELFVPSLSAVRIR